MKENEIEIQAAKKELANLYFLIKLQKLDNVINNQLYIFLFKYDS